MSSEPGAFVRLVAKKVLRLASGTEIPRNEEIYPFAGDSWLLGLLLWTRGVAFPFGLLVPLAIIGIALSARSCDDARLRRVILIHAALYALSVVAFFVTARHRLPVVPLLFPFAGLAAHRLWQSTRGRIGAPFVAACAGLCVLTAACNAWNLDPETEFGSGTLTELGFHYWQAGDMKQSEELLERALRIDPQNVDAALALAGRLAETGRPEAALSVVAPLEPVFPSLDLGSLTKRGQSHDLATTHARQALAEIEPLAQLWPETADAHLRWAERFASEGAARDATIHRASAADLYTRIGQSHLRAGRVDLAAPQFADALALNPNLVPALIGAGVVHATRGELAKAVELWVGSLKIDPNNAEAKALLAKARPALEMAKQPR
jgi:Tfp pilus assembly protein PilF